MSLTSPRFIASFVVTAGAALTIVSCSQLNSPTGPSPQSGAMGSQLVVVLGEEVLADATPVSAGSENFRAFDEPAPPPPSGSAPDPWPPGPPPRAQPGVPVPTPPSTSSRMHIKIDPERVAHSGKPVGTFSCRDNRYTWYYDQYVVNDTGIPLKVTERENYFDGRWVSTNKQGFSIPGNGTVVLPTRWCSGVQKPHYTQTILKVQVDESGGEQFTLSGPNVALLAP